MLTFRRRLARCEGNRETCVHEKVSGHEMVRDEELARRLVVRRGARGNCTYDEGAKRQLIALCQSGTVSVSKVALTYGINPNLLHNWIALNRQESVGRLPAPAHDTLVCTPAPFIPVVTTPMYEATSAPKDLRLDITLDNGVQVDLRGLNREDVLAILPVVAGLPCSTSTPR
jgi:transposase